MVSWHGILFIEDWLRLFFGRLFWRGRGDLVSFPIATYDRIELLSARTIPSILSQTHSNVEVLVVADGTPEELLVPLRELRDSRIKIVKLNKRTQYPVDAVARWMVAGWKPRNCGSRRASGDWIYWISDDDYLLPTAVEVLLRLAKSGDFESVSGGYREGEIDPKQVLPSSGIDAVGFEISGPPAWLSRSYVGRMRWNRHSWKKAWDRPSDYDLMKRMKAQRVRFGHTDEVIAVQPEVEGTGLTGLRGAIAASDRESVEGEFKTDNDSLHCS